MTWANSTKTWANSTVTWANSTMRIDEASRHHVEIPDRELLGGGLTVNL